MKKLLLLGGALLLSAVSQIADAATVWTSCGRGVMTVDKEYFDRYPDQWKDYLRDLNEEYCGNRGIIVIDHSIDNNYYIM